MQKLDINKVDFLGKRVLVRSDLNVPLSSGTITDNTRIVEALTTIRFLTTRGAKVIVCSHLGRPDGKRVEEFSLYPIRDEMSKLLGVEVLWVDDCIGEEVGSAVSKMENGQVLLLQNTRFYKGEEENDKKFAEELASVADYFVDDAFATSHRAHASNIGVCDYLPSMFGLLYQKEINALDFGNAKKPFVVVLGGAKIVDKIGLIESLSQKADYICLGGAMANTFLVAIGVDVQSSMYDRNSVEIAKNILRSSRENGCRILLPIDAVISTKSDGTGDVRDVLVDEIIPNYSIVDIGRETSALYSTIIGLAQTVFWNGPLGITEIPKFSEGTHAVANALASSKAFTVVGGGDIVSAISKFGLTKNISYVSTGGGATLEYIAKQK